MSAERLPSGDSDDAEVPRLSEQPADGHDRLGRTTLIVAGLLTTSSGLGLLRDLSLAGLFGASRDTDAFLVAWTIPETVTVLLMEGAMSYLLVPVFVAELARARSVTRVVRATLLPLVAGLALLTLLAVVAAPGFIDLLAPGIGNRTLAIRCFRVASCTILFMGLSGFLMAALRANRRFVRPASTYVAYNVGILATMYALHHQLGVFSAALGLAVGSGLMVLVQVTDFLQVASLRGLRLTIDRRLIVAASSFVPIATYSFGRQAQVFVERIVGSMLDPGSISYMNYASKVAQMSSLLAMTTATVAFPSLARLAGDHAAMRTRVDQEVRRIVLLIMPAVAFLVLFARPCVHLLFQRGAFDATDTSATAGVMRIYSLGLLGQVLVGLGTLVCFSTRNRSWTPAVAAVAGLLVTIALDVSLAPSLDVVALAVGNATGISVSAAVVWLGIRRVISYNVAGLIRLLVTLTPTAFGAAGAAWLLCWLLSPDSAVQVFLGGVATLVLFLLLTAAEGVHESRELGYAMLRTVGHLVGSRVRGSR